MKPKVNVFWLSNKKRAETDALKLTAVRAERYPHPLPERAIKFRRYIHEKNHIAGTGRGRGA